ncbi:DUF6262 family protein [Streptosporangium amethystogenes]|uniref:DUF6262 family protein n=1 Tax=Streptosporangium amethystogenes TaxID=2002 RepID=UPI003797AF48
MSTPSSRTNAANQARHQSTEDKLQRVQDAISQLRKEKSTITFPAVARRAGVSRTFLYENSEARAAMAAAVTHTAGRQASAAAKHDIQQEASWRERALNAEDALKQAHTEIRTQRDRIATLLGQIRDLEHDGPGDSVQRLAAQNSTLQERVRQLTQENRTLGERLQAARSNARFADRRLSQLEAQLLEETGPAPS